MRVPLVNSYTFIPDPISFATVGQFVAGTGNLTVSMSSWWDGTSSTAPVTGNMMVIVYSCKPYSDTPTIDQGWTEIGFVTNGTDAATSGFSAVGSMRLSAYYKIHTGSESNPVITNAASSNDSNIATCIAFKRSGLKWKTPVASGGGDTTFDTSFSVTAATDVGHKINDIIIGFFAVPRDSGINSATRMTISVSGCTLSNSPILQKSDAGGNAGYLTTGAGGRSGMLAGYTIVTAGASTASPVATATLTDANKGTAYMIRLR